MPKIFVDTNVFLDFYESNIESLGILLELKKHSSSIVLPSLVYDEFLRQRVGVLQKVIKGLKKESEFTTYNSALIRNLEEFKDLKEARNKHIKQLGIVKDKINEIINDTQKDFVFGEVTNLFRSKDVRILEYDDDIIQKANKRHLLGQPPGTDKVNICDEVIWETILSNIDDDIIIVSRDGTYKDNFFYLSQDVNNKTKNRLLKITNKITEGLKLLGEKVSKEIIELEEKQIESLTWEKFLDADWIGHNFIIKAKGGGWDPNLNKYEWVPLKDGFIKIDRDGDKMISLDFDITTDCSDSDKTTGSRERLESLIKTYKITTDWLRKTDRNETLKKLSNSKDPEANGEDKEE